jgi:probable rRNA maturation factor
MDKRSSAETLIDVQIAPAFAPQLPAEHLQAVAERTLLREGVTGEVTLVITDDQSIRALNRDYLDKDAPTDVLAFSAQEGEPAFVVAPEAGGYLGDVIISYDRAVPQAEEANHPLEQEIDLLVVHGLLHLLGYDHADEQEKARMWARQEAILREFYPAL